MLKVIRPRIAILATVVQIFSLMLLIFGDFGHDDWQVFKQTILVESGTWFASL